MIQGNVANANELWRIDWDPAGASVVGSAERLATFDQTLMVTAFDRDNRRFLAAWDNVDVEHRIIARTGWTAPGSDR